MKWSWGRKGNYPYAVARVKAKKSLLLTKDNYPKLLMMDLNEIARFLGETQYKVEMAELASKWDGVNLIELGTAKNLARVYTQILGFTTGELHDTLEKYLARWDYINIKTVLRGKFAHATVEEMQEEIIAAGQMTDEQLLALHSKDSVKEILEEIRKKYGVEVPSDVQAAYEAGENLGPIEDYLDRLYYERFFAQLQKPSRAEKSLVNFVRKEVDAKNLLTLLKVKKDGVQLEKSSNYFIEGGAELTVKELVRLASLEDFDKTVAELNKLSFYEQIKDALEVAKEKGSLNEVSIALSKYLAKQSERFGHVYPSSVLPIVDYMIRKKNEVDNIRTIARGKQSGLDPEQIKKLLVI